MRRVVSICCIAFSLSVKAFSQDYADSVLYTVDKAIPSYVDLNTPHNMGLPRKVKPYVGDCSEKLREILNLNDATSAVLTDTVTDVAGVFHQFYTEYYKDVKVYGTRYALHFTNGSLTSLNGNFRSVDNLDVIPSITQDAAYEKVIDILGEEVGVMDVKARSELVVCVEKDVPYLTYVFDVTTANSYSAMKVFVDAHTGGIVKKEDMVCKISTKAQTMYSGQQTIETSKGSAGGYVLRDDTRGISVYRHYNDLRKEYFTTVSNVWDFSTDSYVNGAHDVMWGLEKTYDFFLSEFSRKSYDGLGAEIIAYTCCDDYENSAWDPMRKIMVYGELSTGKLVSLDITAHEFSHAVTQTTAGLSGTGETGALNEGFSDIWAVCVETMALPEKSFAAHWCVGDDINEDGYRRNIPNASCKYYNGLYWEDTENLSYDNGGVHNNSGVLSYWFYLLCNGGDGKNEKRYYLVEPIGMEKAMTLCYTMLLAYLNSTSQYYDARLCSVKAAESIWGKNSFEAKQVACSWYAVGVGNVSPFKPSGPNAVCNGAKAIYTLDAPLDYTFEVSGNLKIVSYDQESVTVEGVGIGSDGYIKVFYNGKEVGSATVWVGGPVIRNITYSNGYFFANTYCGDQNVSSMSWNVNGMYRTTSDTMVWYDGTNGLVTVTATAYNGCGAGSAFTTQIEVTDKSRYSISKNGTIVSISKIQNSTPELKSSDASDNVPLNYILTSVVSGKVVSRGKIDKDGGSIDFSNALKGVFLFGIVVGDETVESKKLIF